LKIRAKKGLEIIRKKRIAVNEKRGNDDMENVSGFL